MIQVFIRLDQRSESYDRKVYAFLDYLGDIGGLHSSLYVLGLLCVTYFSRRIFVSSILKQIYQVKKDDIDEKLTKKLQQVIP